jgi:hypothetical protein
MEQMCELQVLQPGGIWDISARPKARQAIHGQGLEQITQPNELITCDTQTVILGISKSRTRWIQDEYKMHTIYL